MTVRVAMLSQSEPQYDSRVKREAEALAAAGYDVTVICRDAPGTRRHERRTNGVRWIAVPRLPVETPRRFMPLARAHLRVLRLEPRRSRLAGYAHFLCLACVAWVALPALALASRLVPGAIRLERRVQDSLMPVRYLNDFSRAAEDELARLRPDVVHAHDLLTLSATLATSARTVYDAHELETDTNLWTLTPATRRWIARYERDLAGTCSAIVTVSDSIADWLARRYGISRPLVVLNTPANGTGRRGRAGDVRSAAGIGPDVPLVVYVGSVTVDRGLEACARALAVLPGVHLATVGPRVAETERAIREAAAAVGATERIHLLDPCPPEDVVAFVATADAGVVAIQDVCLSYALSFPNKLLECVFAGLPVAVSDLVELRRFVEEYRVGVVMDQRTPAGIADGLRQVLARRDELAPSPAARERITALCGWDEQRRRLLGLYEELAPLADAATRDEEPVPCAVS